jgi:hypothetical protein
MMGKINPNDPQAAVSSFDAVTTGPSLVHLSWQVNGNEAYQPEKLQLRRKEGAVPSSVFDGVKLKEWTSEDGFAVEHNDEGVVEGKVYGYALFYYGGGDDPFYYSGGSDTVTTALQILNLRPEHAGTVQPSPSGTDFDGPLVVSLIAPDAVILYFNLEAYDLGSLVSCELQVATDDTSPNAIDISIYRMIAEINGGTNYGDLAALSMYDTSVLVPFSVATGAANTIYAMPIDSIIAPWFAGEPNFGILLYPTAGASAVFRRPEDVNPPRLLLEYYGD